MDRCTRHRDITEILLKTAFNTIQSINRFNPLPDDKILALSKLRAIADDNFSISQMVQSVFDRLEKHSRQRRKCWLPAFSPFRTMFSKGIFQRVVKSRYFIHNNLLSAVFFQFKVTLPEDLFFFFFFFFSKSCNLGYFRYTTGNHSPLTISVLTGEPVSMESEVVSVVSLCTTEISEITRLKIRSSWSGYLNWYQILSICKR